MLSAAFVTDYICLGGGNAKKIGPAPPGARLGNNLNAFRGGYRLWNLEEVQPLDANGALSERKKKPAEWRLL